MKIFLFVFVYDIIKIVINKQEGLLPMNIKEILGRCDHTLLTLGTTQEDIRKVCDDGIKYGVATVCVPPCYVKMAKDYVGDRLKICSVAGFPNGYSDGRAKAYEAELAVKDGADEIDMVLNVGMLKDKRYDEVLSEINLVKCAVGDKILKVIIETCLLTEDEKIKMCQIISESGADYIKTSTGFSTGGATKEDIILFAKHTTNGTKIKAAGGISTLEDAEDFIKLGADRIGTSRIVKIVKNEQNIKGY